MIPAGLSWLRGTEAGRAWLDALPQLVRECAERWELRVGEPFQDAFVSLALAATLPNGTSVVLKIQFPGRESEHEAGRASCRERV